MAEALASEWKARNPSSKEEIADFYRTSRGYPDDLNAWHASPARQEWTTAIVAAAKASQAVRILDVGAGVGHDLRALRADNPLLVLGAVEPNDSMRQELYDAGFDTYACIEDVKARELDMIICIDVLEHVPDPGALTEAICRLIRLGGIVVEATATHDDSTPLHLPSLRGWSPARLLDRYGFSIVGQVDRLRVWRRGALTRGSEPSVLLCAYRGLGGETSEAMEALKALGWRHSLHRGDALVSRVRSVAVSHWLRDTDGDVWLMIDDDIVFSVEDAQKVVDLARKTKSIAGAFYPVRGGTHLASRPLTEYVEFGPTKPPIRIQYQGTGFMAAHRDVCEAIAATLPLCALQTSWDFWPLFMPFIQMRPDGIYDYLSEDWAFCQRASDLGFEIWADPSVILTHIGQTGYTVYTMQGATPMEPPPTEVIHDNGRVPPLRG